MNVTFRWAVAATFLLVSALPRIVRPADALTGEFADGDFKATCTVRVITLRDELSRKAVQVMFEGTRGSTWIYNPLHSNRFPASAIVRFHGDKGEKLAEIDLALTPPADKKLANSAPRRMQLYGGMAIGIEIGLAELWDQAVASLPTTGDDRRIFRKNARFLRIGVLPSTLTGEAANNAASSRSRELIALSDPVDLAAPVAVTQRKVSGKPEAVAVEAIVLPDKAKAGANIHATVTVTNLSLVPATVPCHDCLRPTLGSKPEEAQVLLRSSTGEILGDLRVTSFGSDPLASNEEITLPPSGVISYRCSFPAGTVPETLGFVAGTGPRGKQAIEVRGLPIRFDIEQGSHNAPAEYPLTCDSNRALFTVTGD